MKLETCPSDALLVAALAPRPAGRRGAAEGPPELPAELAAHLAGCAACRRTAAISHALALAAETPELAPLPDPSRLYWRARVLARLGEQQEAAERAGRPLAWAQKVAAVLASVAASAALFLGWDVVADLVGELPAAGPLAGADPTVLAALAVGLGVAVLAGGSVAVLHTLSDQA
jgi:hypothetical protein